MSVGSEPPMRPPKVVGLLVVGNRSPTANNSTTNNPVERLGGLTCRPRSATFGRHGRERFRRRHRGAAGERAGQAGVRLSADRRAVPDRDGGAGPDRRPCPARATQLQPRAIRRAERRDRADPGQPAYARAVQRHQGRMGAGAHPVPVRREAIRRRHRPVRGLERGAAGGGGRAIAGAGGSGRLDTGAVRRRRLAVPLRHRRGGALRPHRHRGRARHGAGDRGVLRRAPGRGRRPPRRERPGGGVPRRRRSAPATSSCSRRPPSIAASG